MTTSIPRLCTSSRAKNAHDYNNTDTTGCIGIELAASSKQGVRIEIVFLGPGDKLIAHFFFWQISKSRTQRGLGQVETCGKELQTGINFQSSHETCMTGLRRMKVWNWFVLGIRRWVKSMSICPPPQFQASIAAAGSFHLLDAFQTMFLSVCCLRINS